MATEEEEARGLAADAMVETAEGPVAMRDTPKKGFAVMTRMPDGTLGFRQLIRLEEKDDVALVRITFDNGHTVVAGRDHLFFGVERGPVPASELAPGDLLETAFRYPEGYLPTGLDETPAAWGIRVTRVEDAATGPVLFGTVRDTHRLYLTAGVLCAE